MKFEISSFNVRKITFWCQYSGQLINASQSHVTLEHDTTVHAICKTAEHKHCSATDVMSVRHSLRQTTLYAIL